ncbi:hypothetical protein RCL1_006331 [Eukaryota sp. TZLM3-RCL]
MSISSLLTDFLARSEASDAEVANFSSVVSNLPDIVQLPQVSEALTYNMDLRVFISTLQSQLESSELQAGTVLASQHDIFLNLESTLTKTDKELEIIEEFLEKYGDTVSNLSVSIQQLQNEAESVNTKLSNVNKVCPTISEISKNLQLEPQHFKILFENNSFGSSFCASLRILNEKIDFIKKLEYKSTLEGLQKLLEMRENALERIFNHARQQIDLFSNHDLFEGQDLILLPMSDVVNQILSTPKIFPLQQFYITAVESKYNNLLRILAKRKFSPKILSMVLNSNSSSYNFLKSVRKSNLIDASSVQEYLSSTNVVIVLKELINQISGDSFYSHGRGSFDFFRPSQSISSILVFYFDILECYIDLITSELSFSIAFFDRHCIASSNVIFGLLISFFEPICLQLVNFSDIFTLYAIEILTAIFRDRLFKRVSSFVDSSKSDLINQLNFGLFDSVLFMVFPKIRESLNYLSSELAQYNTSSTVMVTSPHVIDHVIHVQPPKLLSTFSEILIIFDEIISRSNGAYLCSRDQSNHQFLITTLLTFKDSIVSFIEQRANSVVCVDNPSISIAILVTCTFPIYSKLSSFKSQSIIFDFFENYVNSNVEIFVNRKLSCSFGSLLSFVKKIDQNSTINERTFKTVACEFNSIWEEELEKFKSFLIVFNSLELSRLIQKKFYSKLVVAYKKFWEKNSFGVEMITVQQLISTIKSHEESS